MKTYPTIVRNRGAALVISLIILLVMTLIGITSMNTSILEEKMAGNTHNRNLAFQAAESALRKGEALFIKPGGPYQTTLPDPSADGSTGIWDVKAADPVTNDLPWWEEPSRDATWWENNAVANSGDQIAGVAAQPAYLIEELPPVSGSLETPKPVDDKEIFLQVTARGVGGTDTAVVLLQTTYKW